jgi:hypothetical protein
MNRTPPLDVRRQLRREIGFGCPVEGCGNPFLEWHHFDPPWSEEEHHRPNGMIALCAEHHAKADVGTFTKDQLRELKQRATENAQKVSARFDWLRHDLLAVVGGNFYHETPIIFRYRDNPVIWFTRDDRGHLLLNVKMMSTAREPRLVIEEHGWILRGSPQDVECPPSGRLLSVRYPNGDAVRVEFYEVDNAVGITMRFPDARPSNWKLQWPLTAVEVHYEIGGTGLRFGPRETTLPGLKMINGFFSHCGCGIQLN